MDKIKRFIDCYIPVTSCTFRCSYCYITQHRLFDKEIPNIEYSPQHVRKALAKERLGGSCLINFCAGGETLLLPNIVDYVRELLEEGHYVMVVTNGVLSKRIDEFARLPREILQRLFFKISYHYIELEKRKLFDVFFNNITKIRSAGASFSLEITPSDDIIPRIDEICALALEKVGAVCHATVARDETDSDQLPILSKLSKSEYKKVWGVLNSPLFSYKLPLFDKKRTEFCYAGDWSFYLNLGTGEMNQCYKSFYRQNIFKDVSRPIYFRAIGNNCMEHHCYNAHSFLALGLIPELVTPLYMLN